MTYAYKKKWTFRRQGSTLVIKILTIFENLLPKAMRNMLKFWQIQCQAIRRHMMNFCSLLVVSPP